MIRIKIKICGITRLEDAQKAVELGVDALGFNFYPGSPRYIAPQKAKAISLQLPPFVSLIGVFVNEKLELIREISALSFLNAVQLHGEETPEFVEALNLPVIKAFRVKEERDIEQMKKFAGKVKAFLLDAYTPGQKGGTGRTFNWEIACKAKELGVPIILAGGINPGNVCEAIKAVHPYAVDVASGVEKEPGIKDFAEMEKLVNRIKEMENEIS
ncbi:MAG: phosphoribosylanthranilate isomerase [Caldiserica bacterium]|nr:phosphoribosylanthranilate isomerase [Caldisericota bacterium]